MAGQSRHHNSLQIMSLNPEENANASDLPYVLGDDLNHHIVMRAGGSENQPHPLPSPQWIHCQKPQGYVEFLAEHAALLQRTPADLLDSMPLSAFATHAAVGVAEIQRESSYNNPGKSSGSQPADSSLDIDAWKERFLKPQNMGDKFKSSQPQTYDQNMQQNHASRTEKPNREKCPVSLPRSSRSIALPGILSKSSSSLSRKKAAATDRQRRIRISERLKALQELLPHSAEGSQASLLDDIIDHIKILQFQIKDLSRRRLRGEPTSGPLIFLEGYGHYVNHEKMVINEPLEEMMGKLMEMDPSVATQLLESRGLYVMPMTLVERL